MSVGAPRRKLELTGAPETLVIPLYARALDFRSRHPILHDAKADELVRSLDYDFDRFRSSGGGQLLAARSRHYDEQVREFLRAEPAPTVLNLGCGLDTRLWRVDPPPAVRWWDVDLPEVIALRRSLLDERPGGRTLAASIAEPSWLAELPADRPLLAVADGVFEYLERQEVLRFLQRVADRFPRGAVLFDVMSSATRRRANRRLARRSTAVLRWSVDDLRELDALLPAYRRTWTTPLTTSRYLPLGVRLPFTVLGGVLPGVRRAIRLVGYAFGGNGPPARGRA